MQSCIEQSSEENVEENHHTGFKTEKFNTVCKFLYYR